MQATKPPISIIDDELNTTLHYVSAGAGVDNTLLDHLDNALTNDPQRHVLILIERAPLGGQPLGIDELIAAAGQGKPGPQPPPPPQPSPTGHPY